METTPKVTAKVIIEMLGAPKEHVEKTLRDYVASLADDKRLRVINQTIEPAEERNKLFTAFVELELEFTGVDKLIDFCFEAMPSSIEILEPEQLVFNSIALANILNDLQARLHTVDMSMKQLSAQIGVVDRNAMNVLHNFIRFLIKDGGKTVQEMAPIIGIHPNQLNAFLEKMDASGKIVLRDGTYCKP